MRDIKNLVDMLRLVDARVSPTPAWVNDATHLNRE